MKMYNKTILDNGVRIVTEDISHVRSISLGVWIQSGSRYENKDINGVAHFIEHMLFKGTRTRSAFDIASAIESVGGIMNAYTGKELTSFYVKIPDYHLAMAIDLLADMFQNSLFDPAEVDKEKLVVLQEIHMLEDTPDEYIHDYFGGHFWNNHPLGLPVLGTKQSVEGFFRDNILNFFEKQYTGKSLIVTAAGNLNHGECVRLVEKALGSIENNPVKKEIVLPKASSKISVLNKRLEQIHVILGTLAPSSVSESRYPAFLLNTVLGGSMSSKLFQEIREKRGLAYSIHSFLLPYMDTGMLGVYFGTSGEKLIEVIRLIVGELQKLAYAVIPESEFKAAKEQMKGNFLLSMESTDIRMTRLAKNEICFGENVEFEKVIDNIDAITQDDVRKLADEMFRPEMLSMSVIGETSAHDLTEEVFM